MIRSITWDQGTEMAWHTTIAKSLGHYPKGTDLGVHSPEHLAAVEKELNNRPRILLEERSAAALFSLLLASQDEPMLRR